MRTNTAKAKLTAGGCIAGPIVPVAAPVLVDLAGLAGFDCVLLDAEHGSLGHEAMEHLVRAAEATRVTPLARVPHNAPHEILRVLDLGVQGVMAPQVSSADEARALVQAVKYHPLGRRGLAGSRAGDYGLRGSLAEYAEAANRETMALALIEDVAALRHLDAILAVEGIDVYFIGASDLAQSMGYPGRPETPEVQAAVDEIVRRTLAAGRVVGVNAPSGEAVRAWRERGVRFFSLGTWHHLVAAWRDYTAAVNA